MRFKIDENVIFTDSKENQSRIYPVIVRRDFELKSVLYDYHKGKGLRFIMETDFEGNSLNEDGPVLQGVVMDLFVDWLVQNNLVRRMRFRLVDIPSKGIDFSDIDYLEQPAEYVIGFRGGI